MDMNKTFGIYKAELAVKDYKSQRTRVAKMADLVEDFDKLIEEFFAGDHPEDLDERQQKKYDEARKAMQKAYDAFYPVFEGVEDAYRAIK